MQFLKKHPRYALAFAVVSVALAILLFDFVFIVNEGGDASMYVDVLENVKLNGAEQTVPIRSEKKDAPLLLYLHGGLGDAA